MCACAVLARLPALQPDASLARWDKLTKLDAPLNQLIEREERVDVCVKMVNQVTARMLAKIASDACACARRAARETSTCTHTHQPCVALLAGLGQMYLRHRCKCILEPL